MGNAGSGSWFTYGDDTIPVVLRVMDVQGLPFRGGELHGIIGLGPGMADAARVAIDHPAYFSVRANQTLTIDFQTVVRNPKDMKGDTPVGDVHLQLEHITRRCGRSLYQTWFPISAPQQWAQPGSRPPPRPESLEHFDRVLRNASRDPRRPMVCLSLCQTGTQEEACEFYEHDVHHEDKSVRFDGLLQSQLQHARMVQALYRMSRATQQEHRPIDSDPRVVRMGSWTGDDDPAGSPPRGRLHADRDYMMNSTSSNGVMMMGGYSADGCESTDYRGGNRGPGVSEFSEDADDIIQLQQDIESTTAEANIRINKASDTIRTLKERVARQHEDQERLRQGTLAYRQEADTLELDNERISLQLERRARSGIAAPSSDRGEEIKRLRRDAEVLKEQKDALVLILEDLYGSVGKTPPVAGDEGTTDQGEEPLALIGVVRNPPEPPGATWENMLPRPSELFGVLEG
uniref:Uncharacterized protein n=1 Tax=Noctiluca scintillans TaxID=2966 RepID=A0A7S1A7R2_NOCSC